MFAKTGTVVVISEDIEGAPVMARIIDNAEISEPLREHYVGRYRAACYTQDKWVGPIRETYGEARNDRYVHAQPTGHTTYVVFLGDTNTVAQLS